MHEWAFKSKPSGGSLGNTKILCERICIEEKCCGVNNGCVVICATQPLQQQPMWLLMYLLLMMEGTHTWPMKARGYYHLVQSVLDKPGSHLIVLCTDERFDETLPLRHITRGKIFVELNHL